MARRLRDDFPGAWHHVMNRGARRAPVFRDESHCVEFVDILGDVVDRFEMEVHAYALMPNHFHLLVRSKHANLSRGMHHLAASYTQRVNRERRWDGPLFRGRFHSELVKNEALLPYILAYIHLNPLRANLTTRVDGDCWTSHRQYIGLDRGYQWLTCSYFEDVLGGRGKLHKYVLDLHRGARTWPEQMELKTGWLGMDLEKTPKKIRKKESGRFVSSAEALRMAGEAAGASARDIRKVEMGPRANPARRFAVWALNRQTTLTHAEIGKALEMTRNQVENVLRRFDAKQPPFDAWVEAWNDLCDK